MQNLELDDGLKGRLSSLVENTAASLSSSGNTITAKKAIYKELREELEDILSDAKVDGSRKRLNRGSKKWIKCNELNYSE